jgi:hypothetical protein
MREDSSERGPVLRYVCVICLLVALSGCAGLGQRCQSLAASGNSSSYARCVHEQQVALGAALFSIANGYAAR